MRPARVVALGTWARELTLPAVNHPAGDPQRSRARTALVAWMIGPIGLLSVAAGVLFVRQGPGEAFAVTISILGGVVLLWVLVSIFSAARADKTCPQCGSEGLRQLDPDTTLGVTCAACGFADEAASSFYLAEETGSLEHTVLRERRRKRTGVI